MHVLTAVLLPRLESATRESFSDLKSEVIHLDDQYLAWQRETRVTSYDLKRVKSAIYALLAAVQRADLRTNVDLFRFEGPPVPPAGPTPKVNQHARIEKSRAQIALTDDAIVLEADGRHVSFDSVVNSAVNTLSAGPSSIDIQHVENSVLLLRCNGPVIVHSARDSLLIVLCHQLRLHNALNCVVFAAPENGRVIMEKSKQLRFGALRNDLLGGADFAVDDFDWPTTTVPSPNYEYLADVRRKVPTGPDNWEEDLRTLQHALGPKRT